MYIYYDEKPQHMNPVVLKVGLYLCYRDSSQSSKEPDPIFTCGYATLLLRWTHDATGFNNKTSKGTHEFQSICVLQVSCNYLAISTFK
jgi:hypothetical protein